MRIGPAQPREGEEALGTANLRYGFRRVRALICGVNLKAVRRRFEGLRLKRRVRKRLKVEGEEGPVLPAANQAWCLDFASERLENGHARILSVLDCFTRVNLLLKARPNCPSFQVQEELEWLLLVHAGIDKHKSAGGLLAILGSSIELDMWLAIATYGAGS